MSVSNQHKEYVKYLQKWERCRTVASGQDAVHDAGETYLPRLKDQTDEDYAAYKLRASFFNATWRTIAGLAGMLFRKPATVDVPPSVAPLLAAITPEGDNLQIFAMELAVDLLKTGRVGIMVDCPPLTVTGATMADAQRLNIRPTLCEYDAENIINWGSIVINNRQTLSLVVLKETNQTGMKDEFTPIEEIQYRVLDLGPTPLVAPIYRVRLFQIKDDKDVQIGGDIYPTMNGAALSIIPFYFIGTDDADICPDDPPLIDLVDMNLAHYRVTADYEHGCHFTALPTGYITGVRTDEANPLDIYLGSQKMLLLPDATSKAAFMEFTGAGLSSLKTNLTDKEAMMAVLGARMLEQQRKGVEAAETAAIHRSGEQATLASIARSLSIGITRALQTFSDWAGGGMPVSFNINRDFVPVSVTPQDLTALTMTWLQGGISKETLFDNLQRAEIIPADRTFEEEQASIMQGFGPATPAA